MSNFEFKVPANQAEWDEMKKMLRDQLADDVADQVVGGRGDQNNGSEKETWNCPYCGNTITIRTSLDKVKHINRCSEKPFR